MSGTHDFRLHNRTDISDRQSENSLPSLREITPELSTDDVRPSVDDLIHIRDSWWTSLCQIADGDDYQAAFDAIDDTIRPALVWTLDLGRDVNRALPTMERMGNADQGPVAGRVAPGVAVLLDSLKGTPTGTRANLDIQYLSQSLSSGTFLESPGVPVSRLCGHERA